MQQQEFKNMKFRVKDEEHSKKIQEYLFSLGYRWTNRIPIPQYIDAIALFADCHGWLYCLHTDTEYFQSSEYKEYQLKETKSYSLEEVKPVKNIVATLGIDLNVEVTVNGEKISLKELKELLNKE